MSALLPWLACSWQIGRAPASLAAARPRVEPVLVAEPGLEDSLHRALNAACARRLDTDSGPELVLSLQRAEVVGRSSGELQLREARMDLSLSLLVDPPQVATVSGAQSFQAASPLQLEAARRQAFDELAERLVEQALESLVLAP